MQIIIRVTSFRRTKRELKLGNISGDEDLQFELDALNQEVLRD